MQHEDRKFLRGFSEAKNIAGSSSSHGGIKKVKKLGRGYKRHWNLRNDLQTTGETDQN